MKNGDISSEAPTVYIFAGPNGAGKTTFCNEFLPDFVQCREFLNADLIAAGLAPFAPETQNIRAARLLLARMKELTQSKQSFGFETTLSGRSYLRKLAAMKDDGYQLVLFFLWLPTSDLAVDRVAERVLAGGHDVPKLIIRRRFHSGLKNFFRAYRNLVERWWLLDGSSLPPTVIAEESGGDLRIGRSTLYKQIEKDLREMKP